MGIGSCITDDERPVNKPDLLISCRDEKLVTSSEASKIKGNERTGLSRAAKRNNKYLIKQSLFPAKPTFRQMTEGFKVRQTEQMEAVKESILDKIVDIRPHLHISYFRPGWLALMCVINATLHWLEKKSIT